MSNTTAIQDLSGSVPVNQQPSVSNGQKGSPEGLNALINGIAKDSIILPKLGVSDIATEATSIIGTTKGLQAALTINDPLSKGTLGQVTNLAGIVTSTLSILNGVHKIDEGDAVGDSQTVIEGTLGFASGIASTVAAIGLLFFRPLNIASNTLGMQATSLMSGTLLERVTFGLGQISTVIVGIFYVLTMALGAFNLFQLFKFKYNELNSTEEKIDFLLTLLAVKDVEEIEVRNGYTDNDFRKEAERMLPRACAELGIKKKEWKKLYTKFNQKDPNILVQLGMSFKIKKLWLKREMQLSRVVGEKTVDLLKEYKNETDPTKRGPLLKTIIERVDAVWNRKTMINALLVFAGMMGIIATTFAIIGTAGISPFIVAGFLVLAVMLPLTFVNVYNYCKALNEAAPGAHDKKFLVISSVVAFVSMLISFGFMLALSAGLMPLLLTLAIGVFWLVINAYTYRKVGQAEEKWAKEDKPVNELAQYIKTEWLDNQP
jgi:hypothetical protein